MRRAFAGVLLACLLVISAFVPGCNKSAPDAEVIVAAAASLRGVMPELLAAYAPGHPGVRVTVSYGASGDLKQQVAGGAPIDVVVLASGKLVDELSRGRFADPSSRRVLATNQLVLIGPKGGKKYTFASLDTVPAGEKIAIGNPQSVPAGQYAEASLRELGKWDAVQPHLVLAGDVTGVLTYVRHGEVAAGIVYKTEIHGIADVEVLDEWKGGPGSRPEVVAAVTTGSPAPAQARTFVDFLGSPPAQKILSDYGFGPP